MTTPVEPAGLVGWVTLDQARDGWADAPLDDQRLARLLLAAYEECRLYAPALPTDDPDFDPVEDVPERYRQAQVMQARATLRSFLAGGNPADEIGGEGFTVTVFPLDRTVRQKLRPRQGKPKIR